MKQILHRRLRGKPLLGSRPLSVSLLLSLVVMLHSVSSFDEESVLGQKRPPVYMQGREQALKVPTEGNDKPNDELLLSLIQKYVKKNSAEKHHKLSSHKLDETRRGSELASVRKTRDATPQDSGSECVIPYSLTIYVDGVKKPLFSKWPWFTGYGALPPGVSIHTLYCDYALLSPRLVMTAAHCVKLRRNNDSKIDVARTLSGDHNIPKYKGPIVDEDYCIDNITIKNDLAMILLSQDVEINSYVQPITLPDDKSDDVKVGTRCVATGWGKTQSTDYSVLNQVDVTVISNSECHEPDNKICVRYPDGGKDNCEGDSGSQLVCLSERKWKLYGLSGSGPKSCSQNNKVGVLTRVTSYIDWIRETIEQHG